MKDIRLLSMYTLLVSQSMGMIYDVTIDVSVVTDMSYVYLRMTVLFFSFLYEG